MTYLDNYIMRHSVDNIKYGNENVVFGTDCAFVGLIFLGKLFKNINAQKFKSISYRKFIPKTVYLKFLWHT